MPPEDCRGNIAGLDGAQENSMKQDRRGAGHNFWKNDIAQEHNINWLKSIGSKMTSQIQVNLNPQSISQQTHPEVAGQLQFSSVQSLSRVQLLWVKSSVPKACQAKIYRDALEELSTLGKE